MDMLRRNIALRRKCIQRQSVHCALQDGIRNVPPEILALILRFAHSNGGSQAHRVTETLSSVCARFRDTCLQTPQMWSRLRSDSSLSKTRMNLNRSRGTTLDILIHHNYHRGPAGRQTARFLELLTPYASRWASLDIYTIDSCLAGIISKLPILQLPKLARIRHVEDIDEVYPEDDGQYFYSKWNMPSLTSFDGTNVMPDKTIVGSNITECKLYWNAWEPIEWGDDASRRTVQRIFMDKLTSSLHTLQSLQHLELDFEEADIEMPVASNASLSKLKSLTLTFGEYMSVGAAYQLISSFSTPKLDTLHLMIRSDKITRDFKHLSSILKTINTKFHLETCDDDDLNLLLTRLIFHTPSLVNLTIAAPFERDVHFEAPRPLHTIRFEECDMLSEPQMTPVYWDLLDASIKTVQIIKCPELSRIYLFKLEILLEAEGIELVWKV